MLDRCGSADVGGLGDAVAVAAGVDEEGEGGADDAEADVVAGGLRRAGAHVRALAGRCGGTAND